MTQIDETESKAQARVQELLSDPGWRVNNLYWILDKQGRKVKFHANAVQTDFYKKQWWRSVIPKSRQHGMSTLIGLMMLDMCLFNTNKTGGIIDRTELEGQKKLGKLKFAYDHIDDADDPATVQIGKLVKLGVPLKKSNEHELTFGNGSQIWTSPSLRGGTVQFLHVSELGPIAFNDPKRAEEIRSGAFNTVHEGCRIVIESTHKGGKFGLFYEMIELARKCPKEPTWQDWKLFFYGWHMDPENKITLADGRKGTFLPIGKEKEYFDDLRTRYNIRLSAAQMEWWVRKKAEMGDYMSSEFPSTLDEALNSTIKGAVYGNEMARLRANGNVVDFTPDPNAPLYTSWDLGQTDLTCIWLLQPSGPNFYVVDYYSSCRQLPVRYAEVIEGWEAKYKKSIKYNFLPHDCQVKGGMGPSWLQELERAGLHALVCVPVTSDVWVGINQLRRLLAKAYIHATNCGKQFDPIDKQEIPSGLECLECYHMDVLDAGAERGMKEKPVHDKYSHGADALRTFAEAMMLGMVKSNSALENSVNPRKFGYDNDDDEWGETQKKAKIARAVIHPTQRKVQKNEWKRSW